jgi:hypothetical protein
MFRHRLVTMQQGWWMHNILHQRQARHAHNQSQEDPRHKHTVQQALQHLQGALLVVEVLHLPHPELGGLGLGNSLEHLEKQTDKE